jgi:hypothetical protein
MWIFVRKAWRIRALMPDAPNLSLLLGSRFYHSFESAIAEDLFRGGISPTQH